MATISEQIDSAISLLAERPRAFTAVNVTDYSYWEGLEESVKSALDAQCAEGTLLRLDGIYDHPTRYSRYLGVGVAKRWWACSTLRWAKLEVDHVTSAQLARAMALAFDDMIWIRPPGSLLGAGKDWAMVADGSVPSTFVFPWVSLLKAVPQSRLVHQASHDISARERPQWLDLSVRTAGMRILNSLHQRESKVIQLRFGLVGDGHTHTLEEIGSDFGVTRERIRQIEEKALRKLGHHVRRSQFALGFVAEFIRSGGSLLLPDSSLTPWHGLLFLVSRLNVIHIEELGTSILTADDISEYYSYLLNDDNYHRHPQPALLPFLSQPDADRLRQAEEEYWSRRVKSWTRPRMVREALRSLGRAAHYEEIAEECARLFPDSRSTPRSWHAALSEPSSEALGIVWIGRKGMYGLKEHGYSRPGRDLFQSVAAIVARVYSETRQPVPEHVVMTELGKERRELHPASVKMALSINDNVKTVATGVYMPRAPTSGQAGDARHSRYDIDAAFRAFSSDDIE